MSKQFEEGLIAGHVATANPVWWLGFMAGGTMATVSHVVGRTGDLIGRVIRW